MDAERNKKVIHEFYEVEFKNHDLSAVSQYMHEDYIQHNPEVDQEMKGFIEFHEGFFAAIPDSCAVINRLVAEDDIFFVYNTITGTHRGEGFLHYKPTGQKIKYDVVDMFRLRDGKLCEHWDVADTRALFAQVGGLKEIKG